MYQTSVVTTQHESEIRGRRVKVWYGTVAEGLSATGTIVDFGEILGRKTIKIASGNKDQTKMEFAFVDEIKSIDILD